MKETYYRKVGKRYKPINEPYAWDGLTEGVWCVQVNPGVRSAKRLIVPDMDALDAALFEFKDILVRELSDAAKCRPISTKMSVKEQKAWKKFEDEMGDDMPRYFAGYDSYCDIVDKAVDKFGKQVRLKQLRLATDNT